MENKSTLFRFVSVRNHSDHIKHDPSLAIRPKTPFVNALIEVNHSTLSNEKKLSAMNKELQQFISSSRFLKTKTGVEGLSSQSLPEQLELLYDNIVVRTFTKSNTNSIYKALVDRIRNVYFQLNIESLGATRESGLRIVLPEALVLSFTGYDAPAPPKPEIDREQTVLRARLREYTGLRSLINEAKSRNIVGFASAREVLVQNSKYAAVMNVLGKSEISLDDAEEEILSQIKRARQPVKATTKTSTTKSKRVPRAGAPLSVELEQYVRLQDLVGEAHAEGVTHFRQIDKVEAPEFAAVLRSLKKTPIMLAEAQQLVEKKLTELSNEAHKLVVMEKYSLIGQKWHSTNKFENFVETDDQTGEQAIMVYSNGCYLKFPFQVADLRVVEQQTVGYLPAEIAHISNTQAGESNTRVTRRLKRVDTFESLIQESEVLHETDSTSTEKLSLEKEASAVETEESSLNINASASGTYGVVTASLDAGYATSDSLTNANSASQSYAKELVQRVVDRVSNKVKTERSVRTIEEFEETVTHVIDNSKNGPKSYVYRWLNKLTRATLKNYGKRLMFQIDVAHPAHYYLSRAIKETAINIPPDPRTLEFCGDRIFTVDSINRTNYLAWGDLYRANLEEPLAERIIVSEVINGSWNNFAIIGKAIPIPKDYECVRARISDAYGYNPTSADQIRVLVGNNGFAHYTGGDEFYAPMVVQLAGETGQLAVSVYQRISGFILNIEIECHPTAEATRTWQVKTYRAILEGYETLKANAESKMTEFDPNVPGPNPEKKKESIRTELKKEAIRKMFRCNPFWVSDNYKVGSEYDPDYCNDGLYGERVRFLESVFDWRNMTYYLHPYFYADKDCWSRILDLSDDDPHFEAFLQSSFATVRIPVNRDALKERAAVNFILTGSIANYEVVPESLDGLLDELEAEPATPFTYDLNGDPLPEPKTTFDLGIFNLPTSLVILECGTADGIKPIGFPQSDAEKTDVIVPKQYSPAIIADSCP